MAPETPHRIATSNALAPSSGYAHAVIAAPGRLIFLGGQTSQDGEGICRGETLVQQFELALDNMVKALAASDARPEHLVSMQIFVTDIHEYRASLKELGLGYRRQLGRHYPAMALLEVKGLFDPAAKVELMGIAVVPD